MNARRGADMGAPAAVGSVTAVGLLSALVADGAWDVLSWATLAAPGGISVLGVYRAFR